MSKYLIIIERAADNFSVYSPDVLGCVATGPTIEETLKEMKDALAFHFEYMDIIPEPKGLRWHLDNDMFEGDIFNKKKFITTVEINIHQAA